MKRLIIITISVILIFNGISVLVSQETDWKSSAAIQLEERGEVYFSFEISDILLVQKLSAIISIDSYKEGIVKAYANQNEWNAFLKFNIPFIILTPPGLMHSPQMKTEINRKEIEDWDFYPSYDAYLDLMNQFQQDYPDLCTVFSIGQSVEGREIMVARISDNASIEEGEAQFIYTSSMHGDELVGYILTLRLIDFLLTNYGNDAQVTNLVNNLDIWINPLANPDGTFASGNSTVFGATRYNANNIDINRNFPDPEDGDHPDGNDWQAETMLFMQLAEENNFTISANLHGGEEVVNYPWDTWSTLHADDAWWINVSRQYADTAHVYAAPGYLNSFQNGITNGYQWYTISGGRQDYMNYFHNCREFTLELSTIKTPPENQLNDFWEYNYRSLLNYMNQTLFGIKGIVTDAANNNPLSASVSIANHDIDNSWVASNSTDGWFYRPIANGTYDLTFLKPGYEPQTIENVSISNNSFTTVNVQLVYTGSGLSDNSLDGFLTIFPNPSNGELILRNNVAESLSGSVRILAAKGSIVFNKSIYLSGKNETETIDLRDAEPGIYFVSFRNESFSGVEKILIY